MKAQLLLYWIVKPAQREDQVLIFLLENPTYGGNFHTFSVRHRVPRKIFSPGRSNSADSSAFFRSRSSSHSISPRRTSLVKRKGREKKPKATVRRIGNERNSIYASWHRISNIGKLKKRCRFCFALHFWKEKWRCCDQGKVVLSEPKRPFRALRHLIKGKNHDYKRALKHVTRLNTLFAFAGKQAHEERVPGRGVPITKIKGGISHTASSIFTKEGQTPSFGALYTLDPLEAASHRKKNRVGEGIDEKVENNLFWRKLVTSDHCEVVWGFSEAQRACWNL